MDKLIIEIRQFHNERDWNKFHAPNHLEKLIVIEAAEVLECFQWNNEEYGKKLFVKNLRMW